LKVTLHSRLGDGGFADVWKATDGLGRDVAVKIVRASAAVMSSALAHARALARTSHPNIVSIISLERVNDPSSKAEVDGIVMELLEGTTLAQRFQGPKLSIREARTIGAAIASGIAHIHERGMEHGDLHDANIMIGDHTIKVIDILYTDSLAMLSSGTRKARLRRDCTSLKLVLQHLIAHSKLPTEEATKFNTLTNENPTALDIREAFLKVVDQEGVTANERLLMAAHDRLKDEGFVKGKAYAAHLLDETPPALIAPLLTRIVNKRSYASPHREYVLALWSRLLPEERAAFFSHLGVELEKELPKGRWSPLLRTLSAFEYDGWRAMTPRFRKVLEAMLTKDILSGRFNPKRNSSWDSSGAKGTYARTLWPYFSKKHDFAENIITMLHKSSDTQNYVGEYFLSILEKLADSTNTTDRMIRALKSAVDNGATTVIEGLPTLPKEWGARIAPTNK
jgi:serine/threonine-protein kinase RIO1